MEDLREYIDKTASIIEAAGYKIESKSLDEYDRVFNISYFDKKHMTNYSFVASLNEKDEVYIKIAAAFLSGIEEDFTKILEGKQGPINISNTEKSKECKIEYKLKSSPDEYSALDIRNLLGEVEDSIYNVRYRKSFAL